LAEWIFEQGIGEARAALVENGVILEALIEREGDFVRAGSVVQARLIRSLPGRRAGIARMDDGQELLLETIPPRTSEGSTFRVQILREAIGEEGREKRAIARSVDGRTPMAQGPDLLARIKASGQPGRVLMPTEDDALEAHGWSELLEEAMSGEVGSEESALRIFPTPAMTLIDIDGTLPPARLGPGGTKLAAKAIRRMGITGSIGIDLPTMNNKDERMTAAAQIDKYLPQPFERTAVNGFGFIQIIRRRERPNLIETLREDRALSYALALLRRGQRHDRGVGAVTLVGARAVIDKITRKPEWRAALARERGGEVRLQADESLSISSFHAA